MHKPWGKKKSVAPSYASTSELIDNFDGLDLASTAGQEGNHYSEPFTPNEETAIMSFNHYMSKTGKRLKNLIKARQHSLKLADDMINAGVDLCFIPGEFKESRSKEILSSVEAINR